MLNIISILVLGLAAATSAQQTLPTNATIAPLAGGKELRLTMRGYRAGPVRLAPLTITAGLGANPGQLDQLVIPGLNRWSMLTAIDFPNVNMANRDVMSYISCDPGGNQGDSRTPAELITLAGQRRPDAIVLYSTKSSSCNISGDFGYQTIFTLTNTDDSQRVLAYTSIPAQITSDASAPSGPQNYNNTAGGPAPTTAVAMSILYAITGIITLLFLVIIATGAIRAHRNPERYGPRRALGGRTRQSRAKGLARAMLETLPIVKFGDPEPAKAGSNRDIELADANATSTATKDAEKEGIVDADSKTPNIPPTASGAVVESGMGTAESIKSAEEAAKHDSALECSICTESFSTGDDVRVLPCQHKFHPPCIDPWLLNVSGTCPLCRHDLNPPADPEAEGAEGAEGSELPPPIAPETETPQRRRVSRFLDFNRLRNAPPAERIAALRQLREESRADGTESGSGSGAGEMQVSEAPVVGSSRQRLRDRLGLASRSQPSPSPSPTPPTTESTPSPPPAPSATTETPR